MQEVVLNAMQQRQPMSCVSLEQPVRVKSIDQQMLVSYTQTTRYLRQSTQQNYYYYTHITATFPAEMFQILIKQRMMGGSGISWTICKSFAPRSRQITTPALHHSIFFGSDQRCTSCSPTNSVKALKAIYATMTDQTISIASPTSAST